MKVEVEEISPVKKALRIEVPPEVIAGEFEAAFSNLKKRVRIPGFRPGKAPLALIEKRFGQEVQEDVLRKVIPDYYQKAVAETGIKPVEFPAIDRIELSKDKPLSFTATVEVSPSIALKDYTGIPVSRKQVRATDADVDRAISALREQHGQLVALEAEHAVEQGNYVIIDFEGKADGKLLDFRGKEGGAEGGVVADFLVQVGSETLLPGFEESLIGKRKGDSYSITLKVPSDHGNETIRGKDVEFSIRVKEIKAKILPEPDDEFAKDLGMESLPRLREKLSKDIQERLQSEAQSAERNGVLKKLVEMHRLDVPSSLVEHELEHLLKAFVRSNPHMDPSVSRRELEPLAVERVKGSLLLASIAEAEKVVITDEDLDEEIARISKRLNLSPQEAKRLILRQEKTLEGLRGRLQEQRILDRILSKANIHVEPA